VDREGEISNGKPSGRKEKSEPFKGHDPRKLQRRRPISTHPFRNGNAHRGEKREGSTCSTNKKKDKEQGLREGT